MYLAKITLITSLLTLMTVLLAVDSNDIFKKCTTCHGQKAEKSALGKSKIVSKMTKDEIESALIGYKDNTYGGKMKVIMKSQLKNIDKKDIPTLAEYIKTLN